MKLRNVIFVLLGALLAITVLGRASSSNSDVYLPLVINSSNQELPTSIELIEADLAAGILDANTAAIYEVYTVLPNSPLPSKYVGSPDPQADIAAYRAIWKVYGALSPEQKAAVDPYLYRPDEPSSAFFKFQQEQTLQQQDARLSTTELRPLSTRPPDTIQWGYINSATGVKIHYRIDIDGDDALAAGVAKAIDDKIYTSLNNLMGRVWLDDTGCASGGVTDDGGSGALDIYLLHGISDRGLEISCFSPTPTPGWVILNADRPIGDETHIGMIQTATHEMFHTIQDSYAYKEDSGTYLWMQEATAKWVEDYVYHDAQSEQDYAPLYLNKTEDPLDENPAGSKRYYGEYLWPFYLYRVQNKNPNFIRTMFENAKSYPSVDIFTLGSGSDFPVTLFPDFAVKNWNQDPFKDYQTVDSLTKRVKVQYRTVISGEAGKSAYKLSAPSGTFGHLSAVYWDFVFADDSARTVAFYNGLNYKLSEITGLVNPWDNTGVFYDPEPLEYAQYEGMDVQALIKINNTWTQEDWSISGQEVFCRDRKAQRIQELVLIITNSNFKKTQANYNFTPVNLAPVLLVSSTGCYQWKGTFDVAYTSGGVTRTTTGDVVFEAFDDYLTGPGVGFSVKSGSAYLSMNGTNIYGETFAANGWVTFSPHEGDSLLETYNLVTGGPHPYAYFGTGISSQTVPGKHGCYCGDDGEWIVYDENFAVGTWFLSPWTSDQLNSQAKGNIIDGSYTNPNGDTTYRWHFEAQEEP